MRTKGKSLGVIVIVILISLAFWFYIVSTRVKAYDTLIYPKVMINGVEVGDKTKEEAKKKINNAIMDNSFSREIVIETPDKNYSISLKDLKVRYNIDKAIDEALNYGKNFSLLEKNKIIKDPKEKNIEILFLYSENELDSIIKNIYAETDKEISNASMKRENNSFVLAKEQNGRKLNLEDLNNNIKNFLINSKESKVKIIAKFEETKANITEELLKKIDSKISTYTTTFSSNSNRNNNIAIAASKINGRVLMPDEIFSYNNTIGEINEVNGYKKAPIILNNKLVEGVGGGICQVSSTLYSAMIHANVKAIERCNHTLAVSYIPLGFDATVSSGSVDYKFKNTLGYPMYIESLIQGKNITFNIYSNSVLNNKKYLVRNDIYKTYEPKSIEEFDANLKFGEKEVKNYPAKGYDVRVYVDTIENEKVVKSEKISENHYYPLDEIVRVGTGYVDE